MVMYTNNTHCGNVTPPLYCTDEDTESDEEFMSRESMKKTTTALVESKTKVKPQDDDDDMDTKKKRKR